LTNKNSAPVIAPYSKATMVDIGTKKMIFCSGALGVDDKGKLVSNEIEQQTKQALENLRSILENNNCSLNQVAKTTIFLTI